MRNLIFILYFSFFTLVSEEDLINKISKILPTGLPINFIEESSMPDFYVVNVANNQILYVSKDFKFVLAGEVIALNDGEITSLNDIYENKFIKNIISSIKPNESIDFISNNERYKLKIFTDVSCSYCRLLHSEIDQYLLNGITISYLAFPRDGLDSKVYKDMVSVWCSLDPKDSLNKLRKAKALKTKIAKIQLKNTIEKVV
jgi:thiol:disulfide interchange protein DsbC